MTVFKINKEYDCDLRNNILNQQIIFKKPDNLL